MAATLVELLRNRASEGTETRGYTFLSDGGDEESLSFAGLDERARAIAALLQERARPGDRALLLYAPGLDFIAAFFGCLYAGVVAVPAYPPQSSRNFPRLLATARDARPAVALTTSALLRRLEAARAEVPELGALPCLSTDTIPGGAADAWRDPGIGGGSLAFLQYTSGSTAQPKGVMVSHANLLHNEETIRQAFGMSRDSVVVGWLPLYHDMGLIGNVLQPLYVGAPCVLMSPTAFLQQPARWLEAISRFRGTTSGGPNFAYELCARKIGPEQRERLDLSSWTVAFNGAEPVRADTMERFARAFEPCGFRREAFFPCYGLAEATLFVTGARLDQPPTVARFDAAALERGEAVPPSGPSGRELVGCGAAWMEQTLLIVDPESARPLPEGQVGEIWVSGPSVAQGYWRQPEITEAEFRARTEDGQGPFLRTGDLGFLHGGNGGELFVTGRLKDLIILRGRNLYPQDVELAAERSHPALRPGCSAAFAADGEGEERLVLVQEVDRRFQGDPAELAAAIRQAVAEQLEARVHAVALIQAGTIPKTSSGKIQRRACRALFLKGGLERIAGDTGDTEASSPAVAAVATVPADSEVLAFLREQVAKLAGIPLAGVDPAQPVTALGLDSLGAVELSHRVEERFGFLPPLASLLEGPPLTEVAEWIGGAKTETPERIQTAGDEEGDQALSQGQRALWFLQRLDPDSAAYNVSAALRIEGPLEADILEEAAVLVTRRHSSLRSSFHAGPDGPVRRVHRRRGPQVVKADASAWSGEELRERLNQEAWRPFDLENDPLLRLGIFQRNASGGEHVLLVTVHHIVSDLWSLAVLKRDLDAAYRALRGDAVQIPAPPPLRFADYVRWQDERLQSPEGERLWQLWRERLAGELPETTLLPDRPRTAHAGDRGAAVTARLDAATSDRLRQLARGGGTTLSTVLLTGFLALLHRYTGQEDLLVGVPTDGRDRPELSDLVGYLVNPVVIRAGVAGDPPFLDLLARVRAAALFAFEHREMPFPLLVERLQPERDASRSPLFQTLFVFQRSPAGAAMDLGPFALGAAGAATDLGGLRAESVEIESRAVRFEIELVAAELGHEVGLSLRYDDRLFERVTLERLLGHFHQLLAGAAADPSQTLAALPLWDEADLRQVLADLNPLNPAGEVEVEDGDTIHGLFHAQARRTPEATAVIAGDESATYRELVDRAACLARTLRSMGVEPEEPVAVCLDRRLPLVESLLGVLEAGGAYVPIDPAYPRERQSWLMEDSGARVLLTRSDLDTGLGGEGVKTVHLDALEDRQEDDGEEEPPRQFPPAPPGLAYLIYTSGSTGRPKGVAIEHRSAVAFIRWALDAFPPEALARTLATTSVCFDLSIFELFVPLACGGTVVLVDDALAVPGAADHQPTLLNTVPSALAALLRQGGLPPSVRTVNLAGEPLRRSLAEETYRTGTVERLFNLYGPSEDTTYSTWTLVPPGPDLPVTIGRPLAGTQAYVLDAHLRPVPFGAPGELYLGGAGLARGYFRRPELTAERFVPDPFAARPGGRLYRTGDRARHRPDGEIDFLGRVDQQVKVRGFRVEPGEIETLLTSDPAVREALVTTFEPRPGDLRLVAYVAPAEGSGATAESLRASLRERLPEFMVPGAWVLLPALPRTPNGKVDRKALPVPDASVEAGTAAPRGEVEELLAGLWAEILGVEKVGADAHFFSLGGHSLSAAQVVSRVRRALGVEIPLRAFFEEPTVAGLARRIERALQGGAPAPPPLDSVLDDSPAISYGQQRLWFLQRLDPEAPTYNMPGLVRLRGPLDPTALEAALQGVALRQESLRTTFREGSGGPVPVLLDAADLKLIVEDLDGRDLETLAEAEARKPFDLEGGPLARFTLVRLSEDDHALLITLHHAIADGWSQSVLAREVSALYTGTSLPPLPVTYSRFARWQRTWLESGEMDRQLAFWRERLGGELPPLELPLDHARPPVLSPRGGRVPVVLPAEPLRSLARSEGTTLFMTLLAGLQALLHRLTGQTDFAVGTAVANRNHREVEDVIGLFVNTLVLRGDLAGEPTFRDLLGRARETTLEAWTHQDLPFERLVDELQPVRDSSRPPLFQVMLTLQNVPMPRLDLGGTSAELAELHSGTSKFELGLSLAESGAEITGWAEHAADLFEPATVERLLGHLRILLAEAAADPARPVIDLPLLDAAELRQVLVEWNDLRVIEPMGTLHGLVEAQAARTPDATALVAADESLTYRELRDRSRRLARHLRGLGVGPEVTVAVLLERRAELVVSLLAILQAGGAYAPVDPKYPAERQAYLLEDSRARVLITREEDLAFDGIRVSPEAGDGDGSALDLTAGPRNLAYLIYTSGSTGRPKGVAIEHRSVVAFVQWALDAFPPEALARTLATTSVCFDLSIFELFVPLARGGTVVLVDDALSVPGAADHQPTLLNTVPSALAALLRQGGLPPSVRTVNLAGEPLRRSLAEEAYRTGTVEKVFNLYGPSEDTTYSTWTLVPPGPDLSVTIGRPLSGTQAYVLDRRMRPVPQGVIGELYLGGAGLARGYLDRPELTAERFVPDPFAAQPGGRLYRTGDRARHRPDGEIDFLGRLDQQVKVRGFRIEPGEIETRLTSDPAVREALVTTFEPRPGDLRLVAYVAPAEGSGATAESLRASLRERLPEFMVPGAWVLLPALPRTPNGKVDRKALPAPDARAEAGTTAPRGEVEELLAGLWAEILGVEKVGAGAHFFSLGGHSLSAAQVVSRVRQALSVEIPLRAFFEEPTVAGLARRIERALQGGAPPPPPLDSVLDDTAAVSYGQQRLWFLHRLDPEAPTYNMPGLVRLRGPLDPAALEAALQGVALRQESLRTTFREEGGAPVSVISDNTAIKLSVEDLNGRDLDSLAEDEAHKPFDLEGGPLARFTLVRLGEDDHALLITLHHAIADGWSQSVLAREVSALYTGASLPPLQATYSRFARWQRTWLESGEMDRQLAFWRERLGGELPPLELPLDHARPPVLSPRGGRVPAVLPAEPLRSLARSEGTTLFMTLLAGLQALLHRLTGQTDFAVGTAVANRNHREVEDVIGLFVNTLVLRGDLAGEPTFRDLLGRARETTLEAWAHQDLPFERLVDELQPVRDSSRPPLFQVMLTLQNVPMPRLNLGGTSAELAELHSGTSKFELGLSLAESGAEIAGWAEHAADLFEPATVERLLGHLRILLAEAAADPARPVADLPLLDAAERHQLLVEWNDLRTGAPTGTLHGLVEAQAARTPDATALVAADESLTYRELMDRSRRLARHLRGLGVGPEVTVAVLLERRAELVVSLLAILQAGGAYAPVDPKYPAERQAYLLEDSRARVLITREEDLAFDGVRVSPDAGDGDGSSLEPFAGPRNLAYLIYTSGSTGRPKGVAIEHRSAVAMLHWARSAFSPEELAGVLASTSVCFDISVFEMFAPLSWGGTVLLVDDALSLLQGAPEGMTLLNTVPSAAAELVRQGAVPASVRTVNLAGETLRRSLVDQFYGLGTVERVWNFYGPSEDTTYSTAELVPRAGGEPTLGRPLSDTSLFILGPGFQPVPIGVAGEVFITGEGLARGYYHRPGLTAERFLPHPLSAEPGSRLYRVGDLARLRPDSRIEYLGRTDHQVKVRGFRIELGEVEAVLGTHPAVLECAAAAPEVAPGDRRLVGYVVWKGEAAGLADLLSHLRARLPQAMVPTQFVELESLPRTLNGKVDRKRLPTPDGAGGTGPELTGGFVAPRSAQETQLADLWREVLGALRVGVHDDFFELGGHSMVAAQLMARVNAAFEVELPLRALFDHPTVAGLAARIEAVRRGGVEPQLPPLQPVTAGRDAGLPLSFAQERLWVMDRLLPGSPVYNVFQALRLSGPLDAGRLAEAFAGVVRRHEVLRTVFPTVSSEPEQRILMDWTPELPVEDLRDLPPGEREPWARARATDEARVPFDLATGPLLRLRLLVLGEEDHVLFLTLHHIVCDDWSVGVLMREVEEIYRAGLEGREPRLPELPVQYADFAVWQRQWLTGPALEEKLAYWQAHLGTNPPVLTLPTDRPRPAVQTFHGSVRRLRLPGELAAGLRALARAEGATLFMALLAGYAAMLSRAAGQGEVVVGCASANRDRVEIEGLIGFFVNILPVRLDASGNPTWRELLRRVRTAALGAYDHPDLPFERLVAAVQPRRDLGHAALRQVGFAFENQVGGALDLAGITSRPLEVDTGVARLDLTLFLWEEEGTGEIAGGCEYNTDLFDAATVDRFLERFEAALTAMTGGADRHLPELAARAALPSVQVPESNLTSSQLLFWFAHALNPDVQLYFDLAITTYEVAGALEPEPFRQAFQRLIDHCDALRSVVVARGGVPMREVRDRIEAPVELVDLSGEADPRAAYEAWLQERSRRRMALSDRLFDCALVRLAPDRMVWFWNVHHIIADAWSLARIADVLSNYYALACAGRLDEAQPLPSYQLYVDYERELRGTRRWERAREYWERKLSASWSRNQFYRRDPNLRTTRAARHTVDLGEAGSAEVRALTARHDLFSPAVVFATVLFALVHRLSGERTLRVGTPFANRSEQFADVVGLQMNACPLQVHLEDGETFLSLARKIQQETVETAKWQFYPVRNPAQSPIYDVYYNYQNVAFREFCGLPVSFDLINSGHTNDLFDLQVRDFGGRGIFHVDLDLNEAAFDGGQAARTEAHFLRLLEAFEADGDQPIANVGMLAPEERRQVEAWNATAVAYPRGLLLHELVAAQAARTPDAEAVAFEDERISYRELDAGANSLAWRLLELGVGADVRVGVYAERSIEMVVALLGILKAGGAYVPLDPGYPAERVAFMARDARMPVILTQSRLADAVPDSGATVLLLDTDHAEGPGHAPRVELTESNLAYVIFTSGSTGRPKGAMLPHSGICNRLLWMQDAYGLGPGDRVLQKTPFSFDVSVWEFFWPLMTGATLVMARPGGHQDPAYLSEIIGRERITTLHFVPSMLQVFLARPEIGPCASLKRVMLSGEALPEDLRQRFYERLPAVDMHNLYGPTEASVDVTFWPCPRENPLGTVPIGRPIANTQIHLLDRASNPVPPGIPGELAIGGVSLARGYLDRPELTAERFVPDPFSPEPGGRLYRTGDLARHLPGGDIEYLGRVDQQVKLRGFRIELGEIEAAVARHPGVQEAVVLLREDRPGDPRLVAYVVGAGDPGGTAPGLAELRTFLKDGLPDYMVPAAVVRMDALPLTPSGKVDRRALPAPDPGAVRTAGEFVAPRTPLESLLASIWAEILGLERVSVHDSFFELGGNSLAATRVTTLVQEVLPVELLLRHVFESPTVARIATHLEEVIGRLGQEEQHAMAEVLAEFELLMEGEQDQALVAG